MRSLMRSLLIAILVLGFSAMAQSQAISPLVAEYNNRPGKAAKGSFKIQNNSMRPVSFVMSVMAFSVEKDGRNLRELLPSERVSTSETSGRLSGREIREIFYTVTCDQACNIAFRPAFNVGVTKDGLLVRIWLNSSVYVAQSKHPRADAVNNPQP